MLFHSALVTILAFPALISGDPIPAVDGIIGGVPSPGAHNFKNLARSVSGDASTPPTPGKLRVVENSGVCEETTSGVYQASGYGDLSADKSIWFWFFAARNNPDKAPLITWFNGGPGSSSMIGLFQELGPCRINNQSTGVDLNPTSWNEYTNVLFIDQPVGAGFSYGTEDVDTSQKAAVDVWNFLQIWFADSRFSMYASQDFGIWTESYGGHYGPTFSAYFLLQNDVIRNGTVEGEIINLKFLGIGNGLTDPLSQYPGYIEYAQSNPYHPLVDSSVISAANTAWSQAGGCRDQIVACNSGGTNAVCSAALSFCNRQIFGPLAGNWDIYYVPTANPDPYPPKLGSYLQSTAVTSKIGSQSTWVNSSDNVFARFVASGDWMRSSLSDLEVVINSGVSSLNTRFSAEFTSQSFTTFTVNGQPAGLYKDAGTFSYLRVFGAGHEVPAYLWRDVPRGAAALQMFTQIMSGHQLSGT